MVRRVTMTGHTSLRSPNRPSSKPQVVSPERHYWFKGTAMSATFILRKLPMNDAWPVSGWI